ncbi:MarR family winged helix-turn-helix transcriptional regulator [Kerstersia gyiorum]|uniref:DNA-binding MarR family transcriptional regulator n=1 Tax=Kerstersia gyiorum TaxID=206506 RepID=A0A171KNU9_9BURK|nr:MarR family transcriptional regulator [Kerstersia gyiorum]KAB0541796.1 MarR family transcriptional regulator [Kerstersia gyiorum]KKO70566.1 hypothetical protein AAV32_16110 [Kerstersia gyiorum]RZS63871.1 DNA-binding MarR family transcriptional regulator [Kerstersia gyiorum]
MDNQADTASNDWLPHSLPTLVIGHVARQLSKLVDQDLKAIGITASQLPVLVALKNGEKRTQMELARIAGVEQPSMAQLLARMERDGLLRREPSPIDGRKSLVMLTGMALERLEPGRVALKQIDAEVCAGLSQEERKRFLGTLLHIAEVLKREVHS